MPTADPAIIFHAGFHKTGTSSVQAALRLHAAALAPRFVVETRATSPALLQAAEAARAQSADPGAQTEARLRRHLDQWARGLTLTPGQGLLVSCEDFAGHMPGRIGLTDYRAALPIAALIRVALCRHWPQHRLTLLYTTRDPAGWLRSIHWQLCKHDAMTLGARRFARRFAAAADFAPLLAGLRATLPGTPVLEADLATLAVGRLGPVAALYDAARLPQALCASLPTPPRVNQAPPHDLARVFVRLNRSGLPGPEIRRLKRDMLAAERLAFGDSDAFAVPPAALLR